MYLDPCYFRNNIAFFRELAGFTQEELAEEIGVSPTTIKFFEFGVREPSASQVFMLCDVLNCSFDDLFQYVDD